MHYCEFNLLEPLYEVVDQDSKGLFGFTIVKRALFVALYFIANMPVDDELIRKDALVVHQLHKCVQKLLLGGVPLHKVEHHSLKQPFDTDFTVAFDKTQESRFVGCPTFYNVAFALENAAKQDVVLVLGRNVQNQLDLANFSEKVVNCALSFTDEGV